MSPGTVGMRDSKASGVFLLGFKSFLGIDLVQCPAKAEDSAMQVINHDG